MFLFEQIWLLVRKFNFTEINSFVFLKDFGHNVMCSMLTLKNLRIYKRIIVQLVALFFRDN